LARTNKPYLEKMNSTSDRQGKKEGVLKVYIGRKIKAVAVNWLTVSCYLT